MSWELTVLIYGVVLGVSLTAGVAIGSAMGLVGLVGISLIGGVRLWPTIGDIVWNTANSFVLVAVPLFVLMGEIILRSGVSKRFYSGLSTLLWWARGGLAQSNVVGCAIFAAISGSSTATALTIGTVALPEMRRRGYDDRLTFGTLAGGGCLGILIPPSIPMVIYAAVVQESV
ncbi:MAG: TRAP transporter large permease subunit, partial [Alphaproteobacteria bacterium]|nr:TRAP transporter large permease subunit [Alphaproteobacteria bacterium]